MKIQYYSLLISIVLLGAFNSCTKRESQVTPSKETADNQQTRTARNEALPPVGQNKVAYYAFDATPVNQGILPLTTFTDKANIIVVFEGTLWELADTRTLQYGLDAECLLQE